MPIVDVAVDVSMTIAPDVTEAWALATDSAVTSDPRIRIVPVITPGGIVEVESRVDAHRSAGGIAVIAIRPGPGGMGFPLVPWAVSPVAELCAREEIALMIALGAGDSFPWADVVAFARAYPRLAVLAAGAPLVGPTAAKALDATANLILDTSGVGATHNAADLARTRGAYRLAYGSGGARTGADEVAAGLDADAAGLVLAGTAGHLAAGTWSTTFL